MIRAAALLTLAACGAAHADEGPLWELGAGVGALSFPDYRGSSHQRGYVRKCGCLEMRTHTDL